MGGVAGHGARLTGRLTARAAGAFYRGGVMSSASIGALRRDERILTAAAALVTVVVWASAFVGIRSAGRDLAPGPLALGRLLVGSLVLGAFVLARGQRLPRGRWLAATVLCGVLWFGVYNVALNAAERRVDAGIAALLVNVGPILIAGLAGVGDLTATILAEGSRNRKAGELLGQGIPAEQIPGTIGQASEALDSVPLIAQAVRNAGTGSSALEGLAGLIAGEISPGEWMARVRRAERARSRGQRSRRPTNRRGRRSDAKACPL